MIQRVQTGEECIINMWCRATYDFKNFEHIRRLFSIFIGFFPFLLRSGLNNKYLSSAFDFSWSSTALFFCFQASPFVLVHCMLFYSTFF